MNYDLKQRLQQSIKKSESGCWEWTKALYSNGYGAIKFEGRVHGAHRVSYIAHVGNIPDGLFVCHKCDNRKCINPDHLFIGTRSDNQKDCFAKGRMTMPTTSQFKKGDAPTNRGISLTVAKAVKEYIADNPNAKTRFIAAKFGVKPQTIKDIKGGRAYYNL